MDIAARLAEIRAKKALENKPVVSVTNAPEPIATKEIDLVTEIQEKKLEVAVAQTPIIAPSELAIGTTRTSEIDHLAFLTKHQELADAILNNHPRMPVLLMDIHKHLREDPELVTTLDEEQIGVIVNGLKIQTKTELTGTIVKQAKSRDKKTKLDLSMF